MVESKHNPVLASLNADVYYESGTWACSVVVVREQHKMIGMTMSLDGCPPFVLRVWDSWTM
jgi:hypothetical protein